MLRIERAGNGQVLFTLSGRIETEEAKELQRLLALAASEHQLILVLQDVTLVNQDAVEVLARCEASSHVGTVAEMTPMPHAARRDGKIIVARGAGTTQ